MKVSAKGADDRTLVSDLKLKRRAIGNGSIPPLYFNIVGYRERNRIRLFIGERLIRERNRIRLKPVRECTYTPARNPQLSRDKQHSWDWALWEATPCPLA